ncbi:MAG: hypothetical protein U1F27_15010 [Turneriella sp.]
MTKLKTSISLPAHAEANWKQHRKAIHAFLSSHLQRYQKQKLRRDGLLEFNDCNEGLVRVNVYWSQEMYNQLHAVAHALRMSVSHLLWRILVFVLSGEQLESVFSNYGITVIEWSGCAFTYTETIRFFEENTKGRRRKRWHITP